MDFVISALKMEPLDQMLMFKKCFGLKQTPFSFLLD